jgi:integrase
MSLVVVDEKPAAPVLVTLASQAQGYARNAKASETRRGYANDLRSFAAFCTAHGEASLPASPQITALYFASLASSGKATATIGRHAVAIAQAHKRAGVPNPVADPHVREIMQGIRRVKGTAQTQKTALDAEALRAVLRTIDASTLQGIRDRAILLLAFACAGRRSEIAGLDVADLRFERTGLVVTIRRSKTDQEGQGREIGVPYVAEKDVCAATAVKAWLAASEITEGALFRSFALAGFGKEQPMSERRINGRAVADLVKRVTERAGLEGDFAGHSLRAGFITTAARTKRISEVDIMRVSGHRSVTMLRSYVRKASVLTDCPLSAIFG